MEKLTKQYVPGLQAKPYGIPIYIRRESTLQRGHGLFAGNTQHKSLEEIVMYI